jgi:hypothetical protein
MVLMILMCYLQAMCEREIGGEASAIQPCAPGTRDVKSVRVG